MGLFGKKEDLLGEGAAAGATQTAIGGELKGKGFRKAKRAARRQARANRKAQRKVDKFGGRLEDYGGKKLGRVDQMEADYFQDLRQERAKSIGKAAAITAAGVATAGLGVAAAQAGGIGTLYGQSAHVDQFGYDPDAPFSSLGQVLYADIPIGSPCVFFEERCYTLQYWDWGKMNQVGNSTTVCITDEMVDKFLEDGIAEVDGGMVVATDVVRTARDRDETVHVSWME